MTVWIDAQLSPDLAIWFGETLAVTAVAVRDLGLRDVSDEAIFQAVREADVVVPTKDTDFVRLLERRGPPPRVSLSKSAETLDLNRFHNSDRSDPDTSEAKP